MELFNPGRKESGLKQEMGGGLPSALGPRIGFVGGDIETQSFALLSSLLLPLVLFIAPSFSTANLPYFRCQKIFVDSIM